MATDENPNPNPNPNPILLEELISNILSRLPVKTLLRFRCVCKSWLSLISAPNFIKSHLLNSTHSTHHHHLILSEVPLSNHVYRPFIGIEGPSEYLRLPSCSLYSLLNDHVSAEAIELDYPMKNIDRFTYVVGSCNGLICLACFDTSTFLWNPSTRKSRRLPNLEDDHTVFGFAYDESNDEFKVFAFIANSGRDLNELVYYKASVYGSKSDCWRMIENLTFGGVSEPGTLANGAINWVAKKDSDNYIVSLDIETEMYREIMLPQDKKDLDSLSLHTLDKKLCVVCYIGNTHADFWIMNEYGVEESWTKLFKFSYMDDQLPWNPRLIPICFFLNGDILKFIESAIVRYKPKDNKFEVLLHADNLSEAHVNVYVESLVSPHPN